jgi:hypothetical protein
MAKLAHISDIHFGQSFNTQIWKNVRAQIENYGPDILVVSGDLVDHAWLAFRLLAVKSELEDLCRACASKPQLFVVPGNHDLRLWGNIRLRLWPRWLDRLLQPDWFDRIMFNDTAIARKRIEENLGIKLGLNEESNHLTWRRSFKRFNPKISIRHNVKDACDGRLQSCDRRRSESRWPTKSEHCQIAITCFDSNPAAGGKFGFASGEVGTDQLIILGQQRSLKPGCDRCIKTTLLPSAPKRRNPTPCSGTTSSSTADCSFHGIDHRTK